MNELRVETWSAIIAFAITLIYVWSPGPYPMGAFTFIAQPLYVVALVSYALKVWRDLKNNKVL